MLAPDMLIIPIGPVDAIFKGVQKTWETSILTFKMIGKMLTGEVSWKNVTGPITIADYAGKTSSAGMISYFSFIALINHTGVINIHVKIIKSCRAVGIYRQR